MWVKSVRSIQIYLGILPLTVMVVYIQLISTRCDGISMATSFNTSKISSEPECVIGFSIKVQHLLYTNCKRL